MKKKLDFVTNSSSVSFCAWGMNIDDSFKSLPEKTKKIIYDMYAEELKKREDEIITYEEFCDDASSYGWKEYLTELFENNGIDYSYHDYDLLSGVPVSAMSDDMTLREFKETVQKKYGDIGFNGGIYLIEEGWFDG